MPLPPGFRLAARTIDVGTFEVSGDALIAADPGYADMCSFRHETSRHAVGRWRASVDVSDPIPGWGERESELRAVYEGVEQPEALCWEIAGDVSVDGGRVFIGQLRQHPPFQEDPHIVDDCAVVCGSGFGDGGYLVYEARYADLVVGVKIVLVTLETAEEHAE